MTSATMRRTQAIGIRLVILLLLFLFVYGNADGQQGQAAPKSGGTLSISIGVDPNHLDPAAINATQGVNITQLVAQPLTTYVNSTGQLEPLLATSWTSTPDLRSWTFTLRSGVKFTDGTPFNADAVKKNFDRLIDPKINAPALNDLRYIKSTEVVDEHHVTVHLSQPIAFLPSIVTNTVGAITSPASWTVGGNTYQLAERIVGTGPYKLVEYVKGDHVLLARNDEYWGPKAYYANQSFRVMPDAASREAALRSGQLDVISLPPAPDLDSLRNDPNLRVTQGFGRTIWIGINTQSRSQPLLTNPVVRQALNYAVDKDALIKNVLFGAGTLLESPVPQIAFGYCKTGPYPYDPQKAKQLLQQAGATSLSVTLTAPSGRYLQDIQAAQAIAGYLRDVGIKVDGPTTADSATYQAAVMAPPSRNNSQLSMWGFAADFPDAGQFLARTLGTGGIPPNGFNNSLYSNPKVDQLIAQGNQTGDSTARAKAYCDAQKLAWADAPVIFLWGQSLVVVHSAKVKGISVVPNGTAFTTYAEPN